MCDGESTRYIIERRLRQRPHTTSSPPLPPLTSIGVYVPSRAHAHVVIAPSRNGKRPPPPLPRSSVGGDRTTDAIFLPCPLPSTAQPPNSPSLRGSVANDPPPPSDRPRPCCLDDNDGDAATAASSVRRTPVRPVIRSLQE